VQRTHDGYLPLGKNLELQVNNILYGAGYRRA